MTTALILTPREVRVLALAADGLSDRAIGSRLGVSEDTVGTLLSRVMARVGVSCRAGAVVVAYREGFLQRRPARVQVPRLSPETARALALVGAGRSNREIGLVLGIGERAASSRVCWLMRAFGAVNRANLVRAAVDAGVLTDLTAREVAAEPEPAAGAGKALRSRVRSAPAAAARTTPERPPGSLLGALLDDLGGARGPEIPAGRLATLFLAGLADGYTRTETQGELGVTRSVIRTCLERLSRDWGVRGDVLLVAEGYRRGLLLPRPGESISLTVSESNLLVLLARHGSYVVIAEVMGRSTDTVSLHAGRLLAALKARNGAHAVKRGVDGGVLALAPEAVAA